MSELPLVKRGYGLIHFAHQAQSLVGSARCDYSTILGAPLPSYEPDLFHPVQQAGNVRVASDHPLSHFPTGKPCGTCATEDPENVVLRGSEAIRLERLSYAFGKYARRAHKIQVCRFFRAIERLSLFYLVLQ